MNDSFELIAFYKDPKLLEQLITFDIDGIIVDLEHKDKNRRQLQFDTQITEHELSDLYTVAKSNPKNLICRINGPKYWTLDEINGVIESGANEILAPMIKNKEEVDWPLEQIDGRVELGLMIETVEAIDMLPEINELPVKRVYVGLNDLAIQEKRQNIFSPLADGRVAKIRETTKALFGVAGLTHPVLGYPVSCRHIIMYLAEIKADYSFLRRSFYRDLSDYKMGELIAALREEIAYNQGEKQKTPNWEEVFNTSDF